MKPNFGKFELIRSLAYFSLHDYMHTFQPELNFRSVDRLEIALQLLGAQFTIRYSYKTKPESI